MLYSAYCMIELPEITKQVFCEAEIFATNFRTSTSPCKKRETLSQMCSFIDVKAAFNSPRRDSISVVQRFGFPPKQSSMLKETFSGEHQCSILEEQFPSIQNLIRCETNAASCFNVLDSVMNSATL